MLMLCQVSKYSKAGTKEYISLLFIDLEYMQYLSISFLPSYYYKESYVGSAVQHKHIDAIDSNIVC